MWIFESFADMRRGLRVPILEGRSTPWPASGNRMSACYGISVSSASSNSSSASECGRSSQTSAGRLGQKPAATVRAHESRPQAGARSQAAGARRAGTRAVHVLPLTHRCGTGTPRACRLPEPRPAATTWRPRMSATGGASRSSPMVKR